MKKIIIVVKEPSRDAEIREIENTLEAKQRIVGGLIEVVALVNGFDLICNEEFLFMGFQPNVVLHGQVFYGSVFITKPDEQGRFISLSDSEARIAVMILNRMDVRQFADIIIVE